MFKDAKKGYIALAAIAVAFNVAAFAVPFAKTAAFWIAYAFGMLAILFQLYINKVPLANDKNMKSRYYGFSIARLGLYYLVAQLAASFIEMAFAASFPPQAALIANILLTAMAVVGCVPVSPAGTGSAQQGGKAESGMGELQAMARMMVKLCPDGELKAAMQNLADAFGSATSSPDAALESDVRTQLGDIQQMIVDGDTERAKGMCEALAGRLKERKQ